MTENIQFRFIRKWALRGALVPYSIFINGQWVGYLKNGRELEVAVPRNSGYLIEEQAPFGSCVWLNSGESHVEIEVRTVGGWKECCYPVFIRKNEGKVKQLDNPLTSVMRTYEGKKKADELSAHERTLLLCYEFWILFSDDGSLGEVAGSETVVEMMQALRIIGAEKMAAFCERSFRDVLGNITLPLSDEMNDAMDEQLCELDDVGSRACRYHELDEVIQEFRTAIAQYVLKYMKPEK